MIQPKKTPNYSYNDADGKLKKTQSTLENITTGGLQSTLSLFQ